MTKDIGEAKSLSGKEFNMAEFEKYFKVKGMEGHYIKTSLFYQKSGINWYNSQQEAGGYYFSVKSVERKSRSGYVCESFTMFEGFKVMLVPADSRRSKKLAAQAELKAEEQALFYAKKACEQKGWELEDGVALDKQEVRAYEAVD